MRPSASATKRIAAPSHRTQHQSPYQSQKPVPERTDPGDAECQSEHGKGSTPSRITSSLSSRSTATRGSCPKRRDRKADRP